jgi:hypothetical protein
MFKSLLFTVIAISLASCSTIKSTSEDDLKLIKEQSFQVQSGGILNVKTPSGNIKVTTWDKNEVNLKIYGEDYDADNVDFEISQAGVDVSVVAKIKEGAIEKGSFNLKYEINVPREYNVEADTKGGNIGVSDAKGYKLLNTMGGNISIERGEGDIKANTMGGNISMNDKNGKIDANTMGGNIKLDYIGDNKGIELNTMGGNIHASLPPDINGEADFTTAAGKISCDFAQPEKSFASSSLKAKFNNGGEAINISTSAGNINVEKKQ